VANSKDILHWFNEMLFKEGHTKWKKSSTQWNYVKWKFHIPSTKEKIWMPTELVK